jgi:hypothetical protein
MEVQLRVVLDTSFAEEKEAQSWRYIWMADGQMSFEHVVAWKQLGHW